MVTGPSLMRETCMSAPKTPRPTSLPSALDKVSQYFS